MALQSMGDDMSGLDIVGDGTDGDMMLGADGIVVGRGRHHGRARVPTPRWMNATTSQGVSSPQEELDILPFDGVAALTLTAGQSAVLTAAPQRPFRGERLIISAVTSGGDDGSNLVAISPAIYVGAVQVGAAQGQIPISAFAPTAFGVRLSWPAAGQGTLIKIFLVVVATVADATVAVQASVFGRAMR